MACIPRENDGSVFRGILGAWQRFSGLAFMATPLATQVIEHLRCSYSVEQDLYKCASMADLGSSFSVENVVSQIHI